VLARLRASTAPALLQATQEQLHEFSVQARRDLRAAGAPGRAGRSGAAARQGCRVQGWRGAGGAAVARVAWLAWLARRRMHGSALQPACTAAALLRCSNQAVQPVLQGLAA